VLDLILNQGPPPPFDPRQAVKRFARALTAYSVSTVSGDAYAGETFREDFRREGISYRVAAPTTGELYEGLEPILNAGELRLLDAPKLEQELLGLVWRGGKITHPGGEHDDWATAVGGRRLATRPPRAAGGGRAWVAEGCPSRRPTLRAGAGARCGPDGGNPAGPHRRASRLGAHAVPRREGVMGPRHRCHLSCRR